MLIQETGKAARLTKKAIEYYTEQGLVSPEVLDNGYRDFGPEEVERLRRISLLRRLGLSTGEIREALADDTGGALRQMAMTRELRALRVRDQKVLLERLGSGVGWDEISGALEALERSASVTEKLLESFPGDYGRFVCLHFARFLGEPITTGEQQAAYEEILQFLDKMPPLDLPESIRSFWEDSTRHLTVQNVGDMLENTKQSLENPDAFLSENKEMLEWYLAYRQSEEFQQSPAGRLRAVLLEFNSTSGYYDCFIPAMKALSPSYAAYCLQMEAANEKLLARYPEIGGLDVPKP